MLDTIFIGTSGLLNHSKGLRVVGNNLANVNTPGFKSSQLQFGALVDQGSQGEAQKQSGNSTTGNGIESLGAKVSFRAGLEQSTGNPLDLNINGNGFYAIKRDGEILYTRAGDFRFDDKGIMVNSNGDKVLALDANGQLSEISADNYARSMPKATSVVKFAGNITSTVATPAVDVTVANVAVFDPNGVNRPLTLVIKDTSGGNYSVTVKDASGATVHTGAIKFAAGFPVAGQDVLNFTYSPTGVTPFAVKLDFSTNVTSLVTPSTVAVSSQDGYAPGTKTDQSVDADGNITIHYSNGQTSKAQRLALADFKAPDDLTQVSGSAFAKRSGATVTYGYAGADTFGSLVAGRREGSNVDLAEEFSNLILMQRGYQASSHVISTANEMIQQLFDMKGNR